ncbi:hypothetical protein VZT92_001198 [Zoarces viviparus]|uniref:Uncharacterized protein n=1 Tax=Zoarces viviparus TaxID=48416 RepID=A0AAW1G1U3_ZOAVI
MADMFAKMAGGKVEDAVKGVMNKAMGKEGQEEEQGGLDKVMSVVGGGGVGDVLSMVGGGGDDKKEGGGVSALMGGIGNFLK